MFILLDDAGYKLADVTPSVARKLLGRGTVVPHATRSNVLRSIYTVPTAEQLRAQRNASKRINLARTNAARVAAR